MGDDNRLGIGMTGAWLPGDRSVVLREVPVPRPRVGQVLLRMRASTICGSDLRAIYRGTSGPSPTTTSSVGEGGRLDLDVSGDLIHPQRRLIGSWVTSVPHMEDLLEHLVRWDLHPERTVTARFPLAEAGQAYATADAGAGGKIAVVMED